MGLISLKEQGREKLNQGFSELSKGTGDLRPAWNPISEIYYEANRRQFAGQGVGPSGRWKPLSVAYAKYKAAHGGGAILQRTGRLYRSLTSRSGDAIRVEGLRTLTLGSAVGYAPAHQFGTRKLPARPVIDLNEADKARMVEAVRKKIEADAQKAGFIVKS